MVEAYVQVSVPIYFGSIFSGVFLHCAGSCGSGGCICVALVAFVQVSVPTLCWLHLLSWLHVHNIGSICSVFCTYIVLVAFVTLAATTFVGSIFSGVFTYIVLVAFVQLAVSTVCW